MSMTFFNGFWILCTSITVLAVVEICIVDHSGRVFPRMISFCILTFLYGVSLALLSGIQKSKQVRVNVEISFNFCWLLDNFVCWYFFLYIFLLRKPCYNVSCSYFHPHDIFSVTAWANRFSLIFERKINIKKGGSAAFWKPKKLCRKLPKTAINFVQNWKPK